MADKKEKDLTALAQSSSVTSDSFIRMVDKDGKSVKIARDIFLQAIRDALPSVLSSLGGTATQFLAKKSSGGIGYETLANAASLLGVPISKTINTQSGLDADNYVTTGFYQITTAASAAMANLPINQPVVLIVFKCGGNVVQYVYRPNSFYIRIKYSDETSFRSWEKIN